MVTAKEVASQVEGFEERLSSLHFGFRLEMDGLRNEFQRLDTDKVAAGLSKISSLENSVQSLEGGVQDLVRRFDLLLQQQAYSAPLSATDIAPPLVTSSRAADKGKSAAFPTSSSMSVPEHTSDPLPRKLELPIFYGENPDGWLFRAERYFEINGLLPAECLRAAVVCLEGDALVWYYWEDGRRPFRSWAEFKELLLERFRSTQEGNLQEQLLSLCQSTTVKEYRRHFEVLSAPLRDLPESVLEAAFVNGLHPDIQTELRQMEPVGLFRKMVAAQKIEEKNQALWAYQSSSFPRGPATSLSGIHFNSRVSQVTTSAVTRPARPAISPPSSAPIIKAPPPAFKKMTDKEMQQKRAKGLCFRCDEKYSPGHRCAQKSLQVLWVQDDVEEIASDASNWDCTSGDTEIAPAPESAALCVSSLVGLCAANSLKVRGRILSREVVILVDSGASHYLRNFSGRIEITRTPTHEFGVQMGNDDEVRTSGVCRQVCLNLPELDVIADFFPLKLGSMDAILGFPWLASLRDSVMNWGNMSMKLNLGGVQVKLQGDPSLCSSQVSLHAMMRNLQHEGQGVLLELKQLQIVDSPLNSVLPTSPPIFALLDEIKDVFDMPTNLPPTRAMEHAIVLQEGTSPISVRPYRYPQFQKDEIERLVSEMLAAGIIQPSTSPYLSPVLLVKKKDGSWRFCVDYKALTRATVPDKFPIPVIKELLDELHGASIFQQN
ncbi:PREDICTED: uncharacterized protein LOC104606771 [Nelumbo nucifera]|uniref:Uncharacterized protein LOC104606771 n=1 Tax=Nelumbo nucifera TaxID=4432 RepID=A0A1U8ARD0_NELNU|nr:PREDICTED: uncharacterized protein LOC104606771 [Nelumbo nucifera]